MGQTVFAEGEDFGLGYQNLRCQRLVNVLCRDNRDTSAAGTNSAAKLAYLVRIEWRSSVAAGLLFWNGDIPGGPITDRCRKLIAPYTTRNPDGSYARRLCRCRSKKSCSWNTCPCLALGFNCAVDCGCNEDQCPNWMR